MATVLDTPFEIGQVMWRAVSLPEQVRIQCPVCAGQLVVTVILGSGERIGVDCEACGKGYDGARGYLDEYRYDIRAQRFVIASVESMHGDNWIVKDDAGRSMNFENLYATEAEALAVAQQRADAEMARQCDMRQHKRKNTKEHSWSIRYHRQCIKELERKLDWHRGKLKPPPSRDAVDRAAASQHDGTTRDA